MNLKNTSQYLLYLAASILIVQTGAIAQNNEMKEERALDILKKARAKVYAGIGSHIIDGLKFSIKAKLNRHSKQKGKDVSSPATMDIKKLEINSKVFSTDLINKIRIEDTLLESKFEGMPSEFSEGSSASGVTIINNGEGIVKNEINFMGEVHKTKTKIKDTIPINERKLLLETMPLLIFHLTGQPAPHFEYLGKAENDGRILNVIGYDTIKLFTPSPSLILKHEMKIRLFFDSETNLLVRADGEVKDDNLEYTEISYYSDYRNLGGLYLPSKIKRETTDARSGKYLPVTPMKPSKSKSITTTEITLQDLEINPDFSADTFRID